MSNYDKGYFIKTHKVAGMLFPKIRPLWRRWLKIIRKYQPSGRLLDIGCGEGHFLCSAEKFYETYGTDISEYCVNETIYRARKSKVSSGSILKTGFEDEYFDVVTCFDILEHVKDYEKGVHECRRILKNGGLLVVRVPNTASLGNGWKKENWFAYKDETHVTLLSREMWVNVLEKQGFGIKDFVYDGLWDTPYFKGVPAALQTILIKIPSIFLFFMGIKLQERYGENVCMLAQKYIIQNDNQI